MGYCQETTINYINQDSTKIGPLNANISSSGNITWHLMVYGSVSVESPYADCFNWHSNK